MGGWHQSLIHEVLDHSKLASSLMLEKTPLLMFEGVVTQVGQETEGKELDISIIDPTNHYT